MLGRKPTPHRLLFGVIYLWVICDKKTDAAQGDLGMPKGFCVNADNRTSLLEQLRGSFYLRNAGPSLFLKPLWQRRVNVACQAVDIKRIRRGGAVWVLCPSIEVINQRGATINVLGWWRDLVPKRSDGWRRANAKAIPSLGSMVSSPWSQEIQSRLFLDDG